MSSGNALALGEDRELVLSTYVRSSTLVDDKVRSKRRSVNLVIVRAVAYESGNQVWSLHGLADVSNSVVS